MLTENHLIFCKRGSDLLWRKVTCAISFHKEVFMEDYLRVGVIANTHGVHGEVKVFPTTDDVNRFKKLKTVKLDTGKEIKDLKITGVKFFKNMAILKFEGIDNINDIERFKSKNLYVTRENAPNFCMKRRTWISETDFCSYGEMRDT